MVVIRSLFIYLIELIKQIINRSDSNNYARDLFESLIPTVKIATISAPLIYTVNIIIDNFNVWAFNSKDYISIVLIAIIFDWFFGSIKHIKLNNFKFKRNVLGLFLKTSLVVGGGILFEGLNYLTRDVSYLSKSLEYITRLSVFLYPAVSAFANIYIVSNKKFPPKWLIDRILKFSRSLDIKDLISKSDKNTSKISDQEFYD